MPTAIGVSALQLSAKTLLRLATKMDWAQLANRLGNQFHLVELESATKGG